MKKSILSILAILFSMASIACHIESLGYCGENAYFKTKDFNPTSGYYLITGCDTLLYFTTGKKAPKDSLLIIKAKVGDKIDLYYGYLGKKFSFAQPSVKVKNKVYEPACSILAYTSLDMKVKKNGGVALIQFNSIENADKYIVSASFDGINYNEISVIEETGEDTYSMEVGLEAFAMVLLLPLFMTHRRRFRFVPFLLVFSVFFYACAKERTVNVEKIKTVKIDAVNTDWVILFSQIKRL